MPHRVVGLGRVPLEPHYLRDYEQFAVTALRHDTEPDASEPGHHVEIACQLTTSIFVQPMTYGWTLSGGPIHRRVPDSAKKTRFSATIRIVVRKNIRDDGLR